VAERLGQGRVRLGILRRALGQRLDVSDLAAIPAGAAQAVDGSENVGQG
jgi:hypothetical protein